MDARITRDLSPETPPKMGRVRHLEGDGHEAESVHGRADHRDIAGAGGGGEDGRCVPQARDQQRDVLQVEGQVRRPRRIGRQAAEGAGGRERQAEEAVGRGDARQRDAEGYRRKKMVTPAARREAVAQLRVAYEVSERRACSAIGADRTSVRYRSSRPDDAAVRARLRELAAVRRRFGYRRLHILLTREGISHEPQEAPPALPRGTAAGAPAWRPQACVGHTGADGAAARSQPALEPGLPVGRIRRWPTVPDPGGRRRLHAGMPGLVADTSLSGLRVARELDALIAARGRPAMCVSDNGTELTSMAILRWSQETRVEWHYIAPGKPQQNAFIESFNGRLRDELLNETLFTSLRSRARSAGHLDGGLQHRRPHSALGNLPPAAYAKLSASEMQRDGALRYIEGFAPRPVASPSHQGSNEARTPLIAG